jgi:hypothetical protein
LLALVISLSLVVGCKDDPPQEPAVHSLKLLSYQEVTSVLWDTVLRLDWEAQLDAATDSIVIEAVRLDSTQQVQRIHVMPGAGGYYEIAARTITFPAFRFRLRTMESGIAVESAVITFREIKPGISILYPVNEMPIHSDESIRVAWSTTGLPDSTTLMLSVRGEETESWVVLRNYAQSITEAIFPVRSIQRESFIFRVATADGSVFAVTPRIHVVPDTGDSPIVLLAPHTGDTLIYHKDALIWAPVHGQAGGIQSVSIKYDIGASKGRHGGVYPASQMFIPLMSIDPGTPPFVSFLFSSDGGSTWREDNVFAREHQRLLLPYTAMHNCYLRMRATSGARVFEDTVGPFDIVDEVEPLFEWKVGDQLRYMRKFKEAIIDTLTLEFTAREASADLIRYSVSEYSRADDTTRHYTITEDKKNMHRLEGWRIPPTDIYRYVDKHVESTMVEWYNDIEQIVKVTISRGLGITRIFTRYQYPYPETYYETVLLE